jgi:hypothetical protein
VNIHETLDPGNVLMFRTSIIQKNKGAHLSDNVKIIAVSHTEDIMDHLNKRQRVEIW